METEGKYGDAKVRTNWQYEEDKEIEGNKRSVEDIGSQMQGHSFWWNIDLLGLRTTHSFDAMKVQYLSMGE